MQYKIIPHFLISKLNELYCSLTEMSKWMSESPHITLTFFLKQLMWGSGNTVFDFQNTALFLCVRLNQSINKWKIIENHIVVIVWPECLLPYHWGSFSHASLHKAINKKSTLFSWTYEVKKMTIFTLLIYHIFLLS